MGLTTYWRFIKIESAIYYKLNVSLRNQIIRKVLTILKDGYERKQGESTRDSRIENKSDDVRFRCKLAGQRGYYASFRGGGGRLRAEADRTAREDDGGASPQSISRDIYGLRSGLGEDIPRGNRTIKLFPHYQLPDPDPSEAFYDELPLLKQNLKIQKEQYGREKENTIVLPRYEYHRLSIDAKKEGGTLWRTETQHRPSEAEYGVYEADRGGEGTQKEEVAPRYQLPNPDPSEAFYDELPLLKQNLKIQKEQYDRERKENTIVLPRVDS
jgi:hypothetical protein